MQYQIMKTQKLFFETSELNKHLIKNLQFTINVILDKGDEVENLADTGD